MYRTIYIFGLFFLLSFFVSYHQASAQKNDTIQIKKLMDEALSFNNKDNKKAELLTREIIRKSEAINYLKGIAFGWKLIGYINLQAGNYQLAIENNKNALKYYHKINYKPAVIAGCYNNIGICYAHLGQIDSAMTYFMSAINILPDALTYYNVANAFKDTKNYSKAISYYSKAISLARSTKDSIILIASLADQGTIHSSLKNYKQAFIYLREALSISRSIHNDQYLNILYTTFAKLYLQLHNVDSAITISRKAIDISKAAGDFNNYIANSINLADGLKMSNRHAERIPILLKALQESKQVQDSSFLGDIYRGLGDAYYHQGKFKESSDYLQNYITYTDSALNEKSNRAVAELEVKYRTAQKEKALVNKQLELSKKDLQLQKSKQYTYLIMGALAIVIVLIVMLYLYFKIKAREQKKKVQLIEQQKEIDILQSVMQQKDEFLSIASHELKTPLTSIKASLQFVNQSMAKEPENKHTQFIKKANKHVEKLARLVEDLVDVTKIQEGKLTLDKTFFHVKSMLTDCIEQVQDDKHSIELQLQEDFSILADKHRIEQVVINLLTNAIKYSPDSDRIICKISSNKSAIKFSVQDFGIGIPSDKIKHVFDRFYRVENDSRNFSGMGLGLFISADIVKKHEGRIGVLSKEGRGSEFWFELPFKEREAVVTVADTNLTLSRV